MIEEVIKTEFNCHASRGNDDLLGRAVLPMIKNRQKNQPLEANLSLQLAPSFERDEAARSYGRLTTAID